MRVDDRRKRNPTPEVPTEVWAQHLYEARMRRGLTQPQLARKAGLVQQTISKLERGEHCPTDEVKLRLALALEVPPADLFPWPPLPELVTAGHG